MTLLALETATDVCGAALSRDDAVVAEAHLHRPRVHARHLTPLIEDVLRHADVAADALDAIAVSMGPGSYTGLRIGVSTAKGWAAAVGAELVGVPTLEALAARAGPAAQPGDVACALLDARRDEVYAAAYRVGPDEVDLQAGPDALAVDALPDWLGSVEGRLWLLGDGAAKARETLSRVGAPTTVLPPDRTGPSAAWVARRAGPRLATGDTADVATFEPFYLKDFHGTPAPPPLET
jgi:tRNA threonylcarbamoyladenosine biosynthesis protein TsaB